MHTLYWFVQGGNTIHDEDDNMRVMMKKAADILNIKEHMAGYNPNQRKLLYSAADIEGHRGTVRVCILSLSLSLSLSAFCDYLLTNYHND